MGDDDEYLDGYNLYLQERCSGRIRLSRGVINNVATFRRSQNSIRAYGYNLTNFATWLYCEECHPDLGVIHWTDVAEWHLDDLYYEHMKLGLWTQEFWATGNEFSLNSTTTMKGRLNEIRGCYQWMAAEHLLEWPKVASPLYERQIALIRSTSALRAALPEKVRLLENKKLKYRRRQDPGDWSPLAPEELRAILQNMSGRLGVLITLLYLWTGMRLQELVSNTLVPGTMHLRSNDELRLASPNFPKRASQLRYDTRDNTMIGVLPDEETSFSSNDPMLPMKIMGKRRKIRTIYIPTYLMREIWRYFVLERPKVTAANSSAMFINKRSARITAKNISYLISEARKAAEMQLGNEIQLTPHVLRHTFACLALEGIIAGRAKEDGHDPEKLSLDHIESYGIEATAVIQEWLGHALLKDTARYLRQLRMGRAGLRYLEFFANAVEEVVGDAKAF
ncbi:MULTISPECIES: tyrosine-type recombinase/integrase [unclassified Rhizobium]|uniref:tyrosine-type recombinase/integrase n=1 Tax=unclassified Rhizobium TaxID=2613769 RepID=UPI001FD9C4C7|nr:MULTISPECIES: tyrosine-type recombinase/integrase [unclassified Rhizobium]MBP2461495.1 site-specific recombinase XerD [Rhizobium sp. PvP014]